jgi:hypothetical protein
MDAIFESATKKYPQLELVFDQAGGGQLLFKSSFQLEQNLDPLHNLVENPPQGKTFRALCILLLLAKYRSENELVENADAVRNRSIVFRVATKESTWIKTIADYFSKAQIQDLIGTYFRGHRIFSGTRGTSRLSPSARYEPATLALSNLYLYESASIEAEKIPLVGEKLVRLATSIEKYECERKGKKKWKPIVATWVEQFKNIQKENAKQENMSLRRDPEPPSYILSARWRELFDRVRNEIKEKIPGGTWYVICANPLIFSMEWTEIFCEAVNSKGAVINFAYQCPQAGKKCPSVKAQWRMTQPQFEGVEAFRFFELHADKVKYAMSCWKNPDANSGGNFIFYESNITHPFIALMVVPPTTPNSAATSQEAPDGTWCLLILLPLYSESQDAHCGLCLHRPSQMLDVYYNSILKFFEQGPKDGFLKNVDLWQGEAEYFMARQLEVMKQHGNAPI